MRLLQVQDEFSLLKSLSQLLLEQVYQYLKQQVQWLLILEVGETLFELEARLERVPFLWLDLPQGGNGITAISAQELRDWHAAGIL